MGGHCERRAAGPSEAISSDSKDCFVAWVCDPALLAMTLFGCGSAALCPSVVDQNGFWFLVSGFAFKNPRQFG